LGSIVVAGQIASQEADQQQQRPGDHDAAQGDVRDLRAGSGASGVASGVAGSVIGYADCMTRACVSQQAAPS
jgi:hypothetical protein